jgi:hypothetical protein
MVSEKIKIWTKQHKDILCDLEENDRYIVKREYIQQKMEEHSGIYLDTYAWLLDKMKSRMEIPEDVKYPVWVSLTEQSRIPNSEGNVVLEILIDPLKVCELDLEKWGRIVNYMYIPDNSEDEHKHEELLQNYGVDDSQAYMSPFYPNIRTAIIKSWNRLFDNTIVLGTLRVGIIWELKKEWIINIER